MTNQHLRRTLDALRDLDHLNTRAMSHSMRERTTRADEAEELHIKQQRAICYCNLESAIRADIHLLRQGFTLEELKKALD
jgi:hypothetical protein